MSKSGETPGSGVPFQAGLELRARPSRFADLDDAPASAAAIEFLKNAPYWPFVAACLVGPEKSGRTTLALAWAALMDGAVVSGADYEVMDAGARAQLLARPLAIDPGAFDLSESTLLSLLMQAQEAGCRVLLTASELPGNLEVDSRDLASRLAAMATTRIAAPDDATLSSRISSIMAVHGFAVSDDVLRYLEMRLKRTYEDVVACAMRMAGLAGAGRGLSRGVAMQAIAEMYGRQPGDEDDEDEQGEA